MTECPICKAPSTHVVSGPEPKNVNCLRCGAFKITAEADGILRNDPFPPAQAAAAASRIRENPGCLITRDEVAEFRHSQPLPLSAKAIRILRYLAHKSQPGRGVLLNLVDLDQAFRVGKDEHAVYYDLNLHQVNPNYARNAELIGVSGAENFRELMFLLDEHLKKEKGLLADPEGKINQPEYQLTPAGWEFIEQPQERSRLSNIGFVAMWFDDSTRSLFASAIEPAVASAGFVAKE